MPNRFASGKFAIAQCDRCGFRTKLKELRSLTIKTKQVNILVCRSCWEPDHPQLKLGIYPVNDPQAVRNPRPDQTAGSRELSYEINNGAGLGLEIGLLLLSTPRLIITESGGSVVTENSSNIITEATGNP